MKKIIIFVTAIIISTNTTSYAEEKKTLRKGECFEKHKISPAAIGCGVRKLFKKKDGSPNILGKFFNAKSLSDLRN
tara:strand:- start:431 stop:658 length:228 start_codon:yes stop_codon:yes gene_type:complete